MLLLGACLAVASAARADSTAEAVAPPRFDAQGRAIGAPLSERVVEYALEAKLDPAANSLTGHETLTWLNRSNAPQGTLWFHLYWNAFKNERSTFYRDEQNLGALREPGRGELEKDDWGYSDIKAISVAGGADLLPTLRFQHPDDDNAEDQTVFTVTLPTPVAPGQRVTLDIRWQAQVPKIVARSGHWKDYYLLGQWYPKIGVLEVPPERGVTAPRWNCHQYHATTEFYADFGTFDAKVTAPSNDKVGATGLLIDRRDNGDGTATWHFHQDDVHDFAWTAWSKFVVTEDVFRAPGMPEVKLTAYVDPRHTASTRQLLDSLKAALGHYGSWWMPFPYPHITLVAPPPEAVESGGMEYPTFITSLSRRTPQLPKDQLIWDTTAHEFGHNYWYGMLASNEFEESWLDEGINSYGTGKFTIAEDVRFDLGQVLPPPLRGALGPVLQTSFDTYDEMSRFPSLTYPSPIIREGWKFKSSGDYGKSSYSRPQITLFTLEALLGSETMAKIMRTYVQRWSFHHPRSEDFFAVVNEVSGKDMNWFADSFFRNSAGFDYGVTNLECEEQDPAEIHGFFDGASGRSVHGYPSKNDKTPKTRDEDKTHRCTVMVERLGQVEVPVEIQIKFASGDVLTEHWDGHDAWKRFVYERKGKGGDVLSAEVDPRHQYLVDADPTNNGKVRKGKASAAWATWGWMTYTDQFVQTLLSWFI